jgi:hypothetical protein
MTRETIVHVGYTCPLCGRRVVVLRSCDPVRDAGPLESECPCGFIRPIETKDIQSLDVWREPAAQEEKPSYQDRRDQGRSIAD